MKRWYKRLAAGLLTGAILVSSLGAGAYAESTDQTVTETVESAVETDEETESIDETESETQSQTEAETEEETEQKELKAVANLKAVGVEENTVKLEWDAAEGADGYLIYRQIGKTSFEYLAETEETTYADTTASADPVEKENQTSSMDTWKRERKLKFSYKEQKEYETIEDDIAALEQKIEELDAQTLKFSSDFVKLNEITKEKEQTEQLLEEKMERWEYLEDLAAKIAGQQ